jgi:hypothetical protein
MGIGFDLLPSLASIAMSNRPYLSKDQQGDAACERASDRNEHTFEQPSSGKTKAKVHNAFAIQE